jgi:hypothetical protein
MNPLIFLIPLLASGADKVPAPEDVKAGWVAFGVFIALGVAVALLGISMTRHLRKARDNAEHGVFGSSDEPRHHGAS